MKTVLKTERMVNAHSNQNSHGR